MEIVNAWCNMHGVILFKHETCIKSRVEAKFFQLITEHHTSDYTMSNMDKSMGEIM